MLKQTSTDRPLFIAPVDIKKGDVVTFEIGQPLSSLPGLVGLPRRIERDGKIVWPNPDGDWRPSRSLAK